MPREGRIEEDDLIGRLDNLNGRIGFISEQLGVSFEDSGATGRMLPRAEIAAQSGLTRAEVSRLGKRGRIRRIPDDFRKGQNLYSAVDAHREAARR